MRIHHGYIGALLIIWSILTYFGIGVIGKFNIYIWIIGLILGIILHLTHRKH